jgi:hypothetical protein
VNTSQRGAPGIKPLKSHITTVILAIAFVIVGYFFLKAYDHFAASLEKVTILEKKANLLRLQKKEVERKNRILLTVGRFVDKAGTMGLEPKKWAIYDVNIQDTVSFLEMKKILEQCTNSRVAYYKPISLHIKAAASDGVKKTGRSSEDRTGDLQITLNGKFVARRE